MYLYDTYDQRIVEERVDQFRDQVKRRLAGQISENEFKPLRLQNGLYMQLHAYMLRVAIPYGVLSSKQLRMLAHVARKYDRGYGHFSTRQNLQYNWPRLDEVPDLLADLASVGMHAIQTSGNCIRNVTSDHLAGVARDEIHDPRPYAEIIRQWSTFHPEFAYLPRKFKIAVSSATRDRAAIYYHDIGVRLHENAHGELGFEVLVGGGLGRTPRIARSIRAFLPRRDLLSYMEAILRVYNRFGRRDNAYKARIKILVDAMGADEFGREVEQEWQRQGNDTLVLTDEEIARVARHFAPPPYERLADGTTRIAALKLGPNRELGRWATRNVVPSRYPGYAIVMVSLKPRGRPPGDCSHEQMDALADLADRFSFGEIVVTHTQNLVLPHVRCDDLERVWAELHELALAEPNIGTLTDTIACPGLDYCSLANARSIPIAQEISERFGDYDYLYDIGDTSLKISGCINACGHHHIGNIGILGINRAGQEAYQIMLGGSPHEDASLGEILGPSLAPEAVVGAVEDVIRVYLEARESPDEDFITAYRRLGPAPFKERVYAKAR